MRSSRVLWVCPIVLAVAVQAAAAEPELSAKDIVHRAIEAQKQHEDAGNEVKYDYDLVSVTEKLDNQGQVEKVEESLYRSDHIEGVSYERLVEKDARQLTDKELEKERKREEKFRKKLKKGEAKHNDADDRVAFDEELLSRYDIERIGVRPLGGRDCYVLWFEPKPGKLPVNKTVDRALNKAEGRIWIDTESFEIARIEFELREKVRLWWGMMGSVYEMSGMFQRHPMPDDIWMPERFDFYMKARMLFRSIHVRQQIVWNDFERRRETIASNRQRNQK